MDFRRGKYYSVYDNTMNESLIIFRFGTIPQDDLDKFIESDVYDIIELDNCNSETRIVAGITSVIKTSSTHGTVYNDPILLAEFISDELRSKREVLLSAFDLWEKAVVRR